MSNQSTPSLNPGVCERRHLFTIEFLPFLAIKCLIEWDYVLRISHIDKSIPHITFVLKINWEIDEIVGSTVVLINDSQKQLTVVPVDHIKYDLSQQKKKKIPE
jgi:hypothetical protein